MEIIFRLLQKLFCRKSFCLSCCVLRGEIILSDCVVRNCKVGNEIIAGLFEIVPRVFADERGFVFEIFNKSVSECCAFLEKNVTSENERADANEQVKFVHAIESFSKKNVLRGLHFQKQNVQAKLVRCISGKVLDVAVDLRNESKTFGKYFSTVLDGDSHNMLFIPKGFAHGFYVLSEVAISSYLCSDVYNAESEDGIVWNDKTLAINWELCGCANQPVISRKDAALNNFDKAKKYFSLSGEWIGE